MDFILYTALWMLLIAFASARSIGSMDQHALRLNDEAEQEMDTLVEETRQLNEEIEDSASMFKAGSDAISDSSSTGILPDDLFASGDAALGANAGDSESKFNGLKRAKTGNRLKDIHVSKQSKGGCATITCRPPDFKCQKDKEKCLHAKMQFAFCQEEKRKCAAKKIIKKISNIKKNIKNFFMGGQQRQASDEVGRKIEDSLVAF